jgi:hypothetical protein
MIALQVAIGIVLAYVIIVNQRVLLRLGKTTAKIVVFCAVGGLVVYSIHATYEAVAPSVSPFVAKLFGLFGRIVGAICSSP